MVGIDSVIYFQIIDPVRAAYEAQDYIKAIEQLTQTTLRNIIGGLDLEQTLTSREEINQKLRVVLDEATGKWGIKVNRVELRAIEPPATIRDAMEKGARAERDKRAAILIAEGQRQSQILSAGGEKESAILRAQGDREAAVLRAQADRQAQMLRAEGEAQAIATVFKAIHAGQPDQALLAYQYMQMLPHHRPRRRQQDVDRAERAERRPQGARRRGRPGRRRRSRRPAKGELHRAAEDRRPGRDRAAVRRGGGQVGQDRAGGDRRRAGAGDAPGGRLPAGDRSAGGRHRVGPRTTRAVRLRTDGRAGRFQRSAGSAAAEHRAVPTAARSRRRTSGELARPARPAGGGGCGRADQHRRRVGHADHLPDPAGAGRAAGDGERLQHHRAGAGLVVGGAGDRGELGGQRTPADPARARPRWSAAIIGAVLLLRLPVVGLRRDRAGADRDRLPAGDPPAGAVPPDRGAAGAARRSPRARRTDPSGSGSRCW